MYCDHMSSSKSKSKREESESEKSSTSRTESTSDNESDNESGSGNENDNENENDSENENESVNDEESLSNDQQSIISSESESKGKEPDRKNRRRSLDDEKELSREDLSAKQSGEELGEEVKEESGESGEETGDNLIEFAHHLKPNTIFKDALYQPQTSRTAATKPTRVRISTGEKTQVALSHAPRRKLPKKKEEKIQVERLRGKKSEHTELMEEKIREVLMNADLKKWSIDQFKQTYDQLEGKKAPRGMTKMQLKKYLFTRLGIEPKKAKGGPG